MPQTVRAHTPRGGTHFLFSYDGTDLAPAQGIFPNGFKTDLRAANSYIVAAPSIHPDGGVYKWDKEAHPARTELAELPAPLLAYLKARPWAPTERANPGAEPELVEEGQDEYGARQAAKLAAKGFAKPEARAALEAMIETRFAGGWEGLDPRHPWKPKDVERWLRGAYEKYYDPDGTDTEAEEREAIAFLVAPRAATTPVATPEVPQSVIDLWFEPGDTWAARADDRVPYLVPGILHSGTLAMTVSDPKTGKTWLAFDLMLSVASGRQFVGNYPVELTGPVYYLATEGVHADSRDRLFALARGKGLEPTEALKALTFNWRTGARLDDPKFLGELLKRAPGYALIVVDVLGEAHGADENSSAEVLDFLRTVKPLANAGPTLLLVHHTNKSAEAAGANRIRGSSAWYGAMDDLIILERGEKDVRTTARMNTRAGAPAKPFSFRWPEDTVTADQLVTLDWQAVNDKEDEARKAEDAILTAIRREPGITQTGLRGKGGVANARLRGVLDTLVARGLIEVREGGVHKANGVMQLVSGYYPIGDVLPVPEAQDEQDEQAD